MNTSLHAIVDAAPLALLLIEDSGRILLANAAAASLLGHATAAALVGRDAREFVSLPADGPAGPWWRRRSHAAPATLDVSLRTTGGVTIHVTAQATPLPTETTADASGAPDYLVALTARAPAPAAQPVAAAALASDSLRAAAFDAAPDPMAIHETATGRYLAVNAAFERVFGLAREQVLGRTPLELGLWPDPADRLRFVERLQLDGRVHGWRRATRLPNGEERMMLVSAERILHAGQPCNITRLHDITEQVRAEHALRQGEDRFSTVFRTTPAALSLTCHATGQFLEVNDTFLSLVGLSREAVIGRNSTELGLWPDPAERQRFLSALAREGRLRDWHTVIHLQAGRRITCALAAETIVVGDRLCIIIATHDITARLQAEQEKSALEMQLRHAQKLEALGQLAGGIAHDFNNILGGIIAYTDLAILDADQPREVRNHLGEVRAACARASNLVQHILAFGRQRKPERVPATLHAVVEQTLHLVRSTLPTSIEIAARLDPHAPPVLADPDQIEQVLLNLCTNAQHAMRDRPGQLTVALEPVAIDASFARHHHGLRPGTYARLSVEDTGHGMDEETIKRVFEPFFTTKAPGEGTGLGLSVVHGIVMDHEGAITVRSQPATGTIVEVYLPEHTAIPSGRTAHASDALPGGRGEHILFIDDEPFIAQTGRNILARLGYRVTTHEDPTAALRDYRAAPHSFDLIVTDLTMPHLTGIDLARQALSCRPEQAIIVVSGYTGSWTPESIRALGVRELLNKPLTLDSLAAAVRRVLDQASPQAVP